LKPSRTPGTKIFPPPYQTLEKGQGRIEKRIIRTIPVKEGVTNFPYAAQFARVERLFTDLRGKNPKKDIQFYITSLSAKEADPKALLLNLKLKPILWYIIPFFISFFR
jgi:hypothetical protein